MDYILSRILKEIPEEAASRLKASLELVQKQAVGAESYRQKAKIWTKEDNSPVSISDLLHQTQLQDMLAHDFPEDGLIAEEPRDLQEEAFSDATEISEEHYDYKLSKKLHHIPESGEFTWIYDPIDGTKGYLKGRYYAIALGCFYKDEPLFGIMSVPHIGKGDEITRIDGTIAFALPGHGAYMKKVDTDIEGPYEKLDANWHITNEPALVGMSLEHAGDVEKTLDKFDMLRIKLDSQAKYLAVAACELDAYIRQSRTDRPRDLMWDHMPGILIAREAGAFVESFDGSTVTMKPESQIKFVGGMKCYRGGNDTKFSEKLSELLSDQVQK